MCMVNGCDRKSQARGLCHNHYIQARNKGTLFQYQGPNTNPSSTDSIKRRFDNLYTINNDGCWAWKGQKNWAGYGLFWINGKAERAHRVSYSLFNGPLSSDELVCHHCDIRECVNPDHLFKGTHSDNNKDAAQKSRMARGHKHGRSKLTKNDVRMIRKSSSTQKEIADKFGVSQSHVSNIRARKEWPWLD